MLVLASTTHATVNIAFSHPTSFGLSVSFRFLSLFWEIYISPGGGGLCVSSTKKVLSTCAYDTYFGLRAARTFHWLSLCRLCLYCLEVAHVSSLEEAQVEETSSNSNEDHLPLCLEVVCHVVP